MICHVAHEVKGKLGPSHACFASNKVCRSIFTPYINSEAINLVYNNIVLVTGRKKNAAERKDGPSLCIWLVVVQLDGVKGG